VSELNKIHIIGDMLTALGREVLKTVSNTAMRKKLSTKLSTDRFSRSHGQEGITSRLFTAHTVVLLVII
jgi:hypothetical protein